MMKIGNILLTFSILFLFSVAAFCDENNVATVLKVKGKAKAVLTNGKEFELTEEKMLPEGTQLITSEKSFVKLVFIDKSTINLGPLSSMRIQAFPKKDAGIINLLRGQIRAEVTKNYMDIEDKNKSKLYIYTKTSAMGVRGTDFQVNYNPANQNSSLIVFEGKVAMAHIDRAQINEEFIQNKLEAIVSANTAVLVRQGQISAVNLKISDRALIPTKLAPTQLDALKENSTGLGEDEKKSKRFRDTVPPGLDSSAFNNASPDAIKAEAEKAKSYFNEKTHEYRPAAGTILDLKSVNIISPPAEAPFDYSTRTFVITENFGKINGRTGQFKAPVGYEFSDEGKYRVVGKVGDKKFEERAESRVNQSPVIIAPPPPISDSTQVVAPPPLKSPTQISPPPPMREPIKIDEPVLQPIKLPTTEISPIKLPTPEISPTTTFPTR